VRRKEKKGCRFLSPKRQQTISFVQKKGRVGGGDQTEGWKRGLLYFFRNLSRILCNGGKTNQTNTGAKYKQLGSWTHVIVKRAERYFGKGGGGGDMIGKKP